jgi:hypothetical protein
MALILKGWELSVSLADRGGGISKKHYNLRVTNAAAAAIDASVIVAALDAVTNSTISGYRVIEVFYESDFDYPESDLRNEFKVSLTFRAGVGRKDVNEQIPSPIAAVFLGATGPRTKLVNLRCPELIEYAAIFGKDGQAYISKHKEDATLLRGKRIVRKKTY